MINQNLRKIRTKTPLGKRHLKEVLGSTFAGLIISPEEIWLITAWFTNFEILDNRSGNWSYLNPSWGNRMVTFVELLETAVLNGCKLNLVVNETKTNDTALNLLKSKLVNEDNFRFEISKKEHIKGLITESCFIDGSMNLTFSGANINSEMLTLSGDIHEISEARIDFDNLYFKNYKQKTKMTDSPTIEIEEDEDDDHDFF
tara:strand:+ start:21087 stop:21689 length:603 start_codon:yes stop_codon:yes gene_type:complete